MTAGTKPPCDPWELLHKTRRTKNWITAMYLVILTVLALLDFSLSRRLERSYQREIEYAKESSTLIAENRRLREHCPPETAKAGALVLR